MPEIRWDLELLLMKSIESKTLNTSNTVLLLFVSQLLLLFSSGLFSQFINFQFDIIL